MKIEEKGQGFRAEEIDLSKLTLEELTALKGAIMARAGNRVGPPDFNPIMMATQDVTNPWDYYTDPADYLTLVAMISRVADLSFRRVSLALITSATALSAGQLQSTFGGVAFLGVGAFTVWFVVEMLRGVNTRSFELRR